MIPALTALELLQLRAELVEHRELHAERHHLPQIRKYLKAQRLQVEFSPSAIGVRITLKPAA